MLIVDRRLPDGDGLDLIRALRGSGVTTPALMLTALAQVDDIVEGLGCGANDYLTKPFHFIELQARLRALLRGFNAQTASVMVGDWACSSRTPASSRIRTAGPCCSGVRVIANGRRSACPTMDRASAAIPNDCSAASPGTMTAPRTKGTGSASRSPVTWRTGMGGSVAVESSSPSGTTMLLSFPLA